MVCPEKSVRNYHYLLRHNPKEKGYLGMTLLWGKTWFNNEVFYGENGAVLSGT